MSDPYEHYGLPRLQCYPHAGGRPGATAFDVDEIADELAAIGNVATLEDALAEIRRHRQPEPRPHKRSETTAA